VKGQLLPLPLGLVHAVGDVALNNGNIQDEEDKAQQHGKQRRFVGATEFGFGFGFAKQSRMKKEEEGNFVNLLLTATLFSDGRK
jgi:hypothetical protein